MASKTVVLIHGMYMNPMCWEHWLPYFKSKGYRVLAPAWPGRDKSTVELRKSHPDPKLGKLTLSDVLQSASRTIANLDEKPILIGHSMGGLVTQLLVQQGIAAAGVAIDSAPPAGVFSLAWSFLKSNFPHINPLKPQGQPIEMTFARFQYAFVNGMPLEAQRAAFDRYVVPESRRVPAESLTATARIDFKKPHAPLLLIGGSSDHIIPASLNKSNVARYSASSSITDYKEFSGRNHFVIGQEGWQEVADYILTWLKSRNI